jgi:hypothetical protein
MNLPITITIGHQRPELWHELELPEDRRITPAGMPEVRPLFPNHFSRFGLSWQLRSRGMNLRISDNKWTAVYGYLLWIANYQGFGNPDDPRANYVLGKDLNSGDPKVEALTTGGSLLTGKIVGSNLVIETLDVHNPPSLDWIMQRPWFWTYAVSMDGKGKPRRFAQGLQLNGEIVPIIHPLIADPGRFPLITIPLWRVERWTAPELPDPYTIYSPK